MQLLLLLLFCSGAGGWGWAGWGWSRARRGCSGGTRLGFVGLHWGVAGHTLICDLRHIARGRVWDRIGHNLGPAVGQGYTVGTRGGVPIPGLSGSKVGFGVVVSNSISVGVDGWDWGRLMVDWGCMSWDWFVCWSWGRLVSWGWLVGRGWGSRKLETLGGWVVVCVGW